MARPLDPQKKKSILNAAKKVFIRDGFSNTRMADIAVEAEVAAGTLYRYFESKEALSIEIANDFFERCLIVVGDTLPLIAEPGGIERHIDAVIEIARSEKEVLHMASSEALCKDPRDDEAHLKFLNLTAGILQDLMDKDLIRKYDSKSLSDIIGWMIHSLIMTGIVFEFLDLETQKKTLVKMLSAIFFGDNEPGLKPELQT
ncbi:MAG: TetR/AcrR family transcriptional regulator [Candidatus Obscuribacterales bacterium]|nr:TetR/AcrR family transcriptional regulator [Candidatus Obscuribacterales bacterium]